MESKEELFDKIKTLDVKRKVDKPSMIKVKKQPKKKRRLLNSSERLKRDLVINLDILPEDDHMTALIKERVKSKKITMEYLYERLPQGKAYNLFYGLGTRSTMQWKTFETWCELLNVDYKISLVDRKE